MISGVKTVSFYLVCYMLIYTHAFIKDVFKCHVKVCMNVHNEPKPVQIHILRWYQCWFDPGRQCTVDTIEPDIYRSGSVVQCR